MRKLWSWAKVSLARCSVYNKVSETGKDDDRLVVGQFEILRARSLAPLVKARGFGMTALKIRPKLACYRPSR
jgi:hypothetical protein